MECLVTTCDHLLSHSQMPFSTRVQEHAKIDFKMLAGDFLSGPVLRTLRFH